jgi:hypothetical protein
MLELPSAEYVLLKVPLMKVCTSPTFEDIKKEMKEYGDVPFGANSPTALFRRNQWKITFVWAILVLTSLPVHLFLNGITGYSIQAWPVEGRVVNSTTQVTPAEHAWNPGFVQPVSCAEYLASAENWVTEFSNLTIVVRGPSLADKYQTFIDSWNTGIRENQGPPSANEIDSCFMDARTPKCQVTVRWFPLVVTTVAMVIKSITAYIAITRSNHFKHRLYNSLGDFIAVAARNREELSVPNECLANSGEYRKRRLQAVTGGAGIPIRAVNGRRIWIRYLGFLDWSVWLFWIGSIATSWVLVEKSLDTVRREFRNADSSEITNLFALFSIAGFGKISLAFIISNSGGETAFDGRNAAGLPLQLALANSPQFWFSLGYLLWNNQITRIWGEHEWRSFAGRRKPPRVSYGADVAGVRNTRWLQLPYSLSGLLMVVSTTMHWVVSQSLFVIEVENMSGLPNNAEPGIIFAICYSPTAIFVVALMGSLLIFAITIYYFLPFRSVMPFMAGSARVVFASCTIVPKDLPVDGIMWGDVSDEWGRLAGFGENAKGIQLGEIYPERYKRSTTKDSASDRPTTARTTMTYSSDMRDPFVGKSETLTSRRSRGDDFYGRNPELEPLTPTSSDYTTRYGRPTTKDSWTTVSQNAERQITPRPRDVKQMPSNSSRYSQSPLQTRSPVGDDDLGGGYDSNGSVNRQGFSLHDHPGFNRARDSSIRDRQVFDSPLALGDDSDREPEWKGWGVNQEDGNESDVEISHGDERRSRGWARNSTYDTRQRQEEDTTLVDHQDGWRGWGV